jgi:hypothetical protein
MGLRDVLLAPLDLIRALPGIPALNLRPFQVYQRVRVWAGGRPGLGAVTETITQVFNTQVINSVANVYPVRVQKVAKRDVIASGGQFSDNDYKVGPMTPSYGTPPLSGGYGQSSFDPPPIASAVEVVWWVLGPDLPPAPGVIFDKISEEGTDLHYYVWLRQTGKRLN